MHNQRAISGFMGSSKTKKQKAPARRSTPRTSHTISRACLDTLEGRMLLSAYVVATWGTDAGPGTLAQPFRTVQEAANIANTGDIVEIEGGTYHETVTPVHSGVTFTNYNNESVTISGTDPVTGFTNFSNSIYQANSPVNLGEGNNQIFVDGVMLNEAHFPNTSLDVSHPVEDTIGSYSNSTIYDSSLTQAAGYWTGALIHITPGSEWVSYTGTVTNSGPGWITVSLPTLTGYEVPDAGNSYYLFGKFQALDSPGEWYMDANNELYLWDQYGDNPANHDVEIKDRQYGFNLTGVANTTIEGINLFACTITTSYSSTNTTINDINASYIVQFANIGANGWGPPGPYGIELWGNGSLLENSTIAYSAGDGVFVGGNNVRVTNNTIHDVDYSATDAAGILDYGSNDELDNNTIYNAGRDGINFRGTTNINILSNTIHDCALQTDDAGGIYTFGNTGGGTIAGNTVYNVVSEYNLSNNRFGTAGIMLDNNSANFTVYGNTTENVNTGLRMNFTSLNEIIHNNNLGGLDTSIDSNGNGDWTGTQIYDNTFYNPNQILGINYTSYGNTFANGNPVLPPPTTTVYTPPPAPASPPPPPPPAVTAAPLATSIWNNSVVPPTSLQNVSDPNITAAGGVELGLKFQSDVAGYITGVRFYKGILNSGVHTGELWTSSGQLLASATFTNETATGWQQVSFSTSVAIAANTTYIVSYHTTAGYITYGPQAFVSSGVTDDQLQALANGVDGNNGVYVYGASAFPSQYNGQAPSYAVDVVFSSTPAQTQSVSSLTNAGVQTYAQQVTDLNIAAAGGVELGMKFQSDVAGTVTGVEFWKGTQGGTQTGELWSSTGQLLATATFTAETASGWQQVTFSNPVAIAANTTYIVAYHTTTATISYTPQLLNSGISNGPLQVFANGANGNNSVYVYGNSAYPSQYNGQAGLYWVDVLFTAS